MATATITVKGQTTIPKSVRDRLHLSPGDRVIVAGHLKLRGESPRVNAVVPAPAPAASAR